VTVLLTATLSTALTRFPAGEAGVASATYNATRQVGSSLGDLGSADPSDRAATTARTIDEERRGLDLDRGPVVRAVCLGAPGSWQVLFVVHHFVTDALSWFILLRDLEAAYDDMTTYEDGHDSAEDGEYARGRPGSPAERGPSRGSSSTTWARSAAAFPGRSSPSSTTR
jgi:hypothetical protein